MNIFTLDFETYWDSKNYTLSKMGPIEYVRDPRFAIQMVGIAKNNERVWVETASSGSGINPLAEINWAEDVIVGHNMSGFDALILSEYLGCKPKHIWDTICLGRWVGLSSISRESLSAFDEVLGIGEKKAGTVVSDGKRWPYDFTREEQDFFKQYCADDVDQCRMAMAVMLPYMTDDALRFISLTARMATEPVFELDEKMLEEYAIQLDAEAEEARQNIMELFHFNTVQDFLKALRSKDKFAGMLRELGVEPPMKISQTTGRPDYAFSKQDVDFLDLREHEDSRVRLLVETRLQFNSSVLRSRCETLLKFARQHKPLPILLSAFKAHTSRYTAAANGEHSSDGIQVQNLSKRNPAHLVLRKAIKAPAGYKIVSCDSSQIEARMLAWLSGQEDLLGHFRDGRDPYAEFGVYINNDGLTAADIVDGKKRGDKKCKFIRDLSKKFILSCGYGSGKDRVSQTLWAEGIRLAPTREEHAVIAAAHLQTYRDKHPYITRFWRLCGKVIEHMAMGGTGSFGGPNNNTFRYGPMTVPGSKEPVMSVMMPSGFALRYPGLRWQQTDDGGEYVYDKFLGRNRVAYRIYSSLFTENCIAEGTLVYTDNGWKPIEAVTVKDKVFDGLDFVEHQGLLYQGVQDCIVLDGVYLTPDHNVLTLDGWCSSESAQLGRLHRCSLRAASSGWNFGAQFQRCNRAAFWNVDRSKTYDSHWWEGWEKIALEVGFSMRLRSFCRALYKQCANVCKEKLYSCLSSLYGKQRQAQTVQTWADRHKVISCVEEYAKPLSKSWCYRLSTVRRPWNFCLRALARLQQLCCRHGSYISRGLSFRQDRQQWRLQSAELPLDFLPCELPQQGRDLQRYRYSRIFSHNRYKPVNNSQQDTARLAVGAVGACSANKQSKVTGVSTKHQIQKRVYDIRNCGPRHRFVVCGNTGPIIVSNCTQSLAFQLLMWQACRMDEAGISLKCNIHDAWATVVPDSEALATAGVMLYHMRQLPDWAKGCPIDAEVEIGDDFCCI